MATPTPKKQTIGELVDELGRVEARLEPHRIDMAREDKLREQIRAHYDDSPAAASFEAAGSEYTAMVGARAEVSTVDNKKALKALGQSNFVRIAKLTLAVLQRERIDTDGIVAKAQTGARSLRIFRRA